MNQISQSIPFRRCSPSYFWAAIACLIVTSAVLLALPYSYGVGTERYSLGKLLWTVWSENEDWQHCMFVPIITGVLIYLRKDVLEATPYKNSPWAIVFVVLSLLLYAIGIKADVFFIGEYSALLFILSGFIWLFGWPKFKSILFPLCFLIFAIPIPASETTVAFPLRMEMTKWSVTMLNLIGLPSIQTGSAVESAADTVLGVAQGAKFAIDIANPCSGIRSLFALMVVSALYAYFTVKPTWKQIVLFVCAIPLAMAGNLVRILILTIGTILFGAKFAIGSLEHPTWFHLMAGFAVFFVALGGLFLLGTLLQTDWKSFFQKIKKANSSKPIPSSAGSSDDDVY